MATPSGTYSNSKSGKLQITFSGRWSSSQGDFGSSTAVLDIIGSAVQGGVTHQCNLGFGCTTATLELDYTAGESISVAMTHFRHTIPAAGSVSATRLRIRCYLIKK